jgi:L-threonine kinase
LLRRGLRLGDWETVGRAATLSAVTHQALLPKPALDQLLALAARHGALGVCAAHSGTALGALFGPEDRAAAHRLIEEARLQLGGLSGGWISTLIGGGARQVPPSSVESKYRVVTRHGRDVTTKAPSHEESEGSRGVFVT